MAFTIYHEGYEDWTENVRLELAKRFPGKQVKIVNPRWNGKYIQISSAISNSNVHYEYGGGRMYFHMEDPDLRDNVLKYVRRSRKVKDASDKIAWGSSPNGIAHGSCWLTKHQIDDDIDSLVKAFKKMIDIFDPILLEAEKKYSRYKKDAKYTLPEGFKFKRLIDGDNTDAVQCSNKTLREIFHSELVIPEYQRDYCWAKQEIEALLSSLKDLKEREPYHLGTVIVQEADGIYKVIDGQQRLTTLTLLLRELGYSDALPLLNQKYNSKQSVEHIAYAKYLIQHEVEQLRDDPIAKAKLIADTITFSVLVLTNDNLDLAYTFFSNQNSKGVPLSDYDLLKAHHLRYIYIEAQMEHLANKWNHLINDKTMVSSVSVLHQTLGIHLYRLRHWIRKNSPDESLPYHVKNEYVAAPIMPGIPPFGEQFVFKEKIQGGTHFFAFASNFVNLFKNYLRTNQAQLVREYLSGSSHSKYADVIETLLFAYYLKFREEYLSEALFCIATIMAGHRYTNNRAIFSKIKEYACNSELLLMIEQASSPTFFLAEALKSIEYSGQDLENADIKYRFYRQLCCIFANIQDVTDSEIKELIKEEY